MRVCSRCCIDDSNDPNCTFDKDGVCSYCKSWDEGMKAHVISGEAGRKHLEMIVEKIKMAGLNKKFDCVLGMSGGYDSSYAAYIAAKLGLRPYCISVSNGYDTEIAISNVRNLCRQLKFHHETIELDRNEFRDLQMAYLLAGVINLEIPSDMAINASVYRTAAQLGLKYIISGNNVVTEWTLPKAWGYDNGDLKNLRNIHKRFGTVPLKTFPTMGHERMAYYTMFKGIVSVPVLDYVDYNKAKAKAILERECDWTNYGSKHHESHITRFYQCYILPKYWGIDKRKAHLSCLIRSGQMTRAEALTELAKPPCTEAVIQEDMAKVCEYLHITKKQLEYILAQPHHSHLEYGADPRSPWMTKAYYLFRSLKGVT